LQYTDTSGKVKLSVASCGCGRLYFGNTMINLTQNEMTDTLYIFKNLISHIKGKQVSAKIVPPNQHKQNSKLTLVKS